MGRTLRQKQNVRLGGVRNPLASYGKKQIMGPHGPVIVAPSRLPDGMQEVKLRVPMKIVTCYEAECQIFMNDRVDPITQSVIQAGTRPCGLMHKQWDGRPLAYFVRYGGGGDTGRFLSETEFVDELCGGIYSGLELIKRGDFEPIKK